MELVVYDRGVFDAIVADDRAFTSSIGIADFTAIPLSGLRGDNIAQRTEAMAWYAGPTLIEHLEGVEVDADADSAWPFRMPVQRSEEHTSELQSLMRISYAVFCLKQNNTHTNYKHNTDKR